MSTLLVLEDAIMAAGAELPDELCPLYLVDAGRRLGGDAAAVAEAALTEHREEWFGSYDWQRIWAQLCKGKGKGGLKWLEVQRAVWFHVQSERQIAAEWGPGALVVVPEAKLRAQGDFPRGQTEYGHLRTLAKAAQPLTGVFRIQSAPGDCRWVGDTKEAKQMVGMLHSSVRTPLGLGCGPLPGWRSGHYGRLFRGRTFEQASRRHRDAARASRQAEAEMVLGVRS